MTNVSLDNIAQAFGMGAPKEADVHEYGTVNSINPDGSYQVQLNGALSETRAAKLCNAEQGDRVMAVIHNGQAAAIGRVGGELPDPEPTTYTGTITKVYSSNGFAVEVPTFYAQGDIVTLPIQFSATANFSGNGTTTAASIPADYAPPVQLRVPLWCANLAWTTFSIGLAYINTDGTITFRSNSCAGWFGAITYIRG